MENQYGEFETATTDFPDVISKMKSHCPMKSISTHGTRGFLKRKLAPPAPMGGRTKRGAISNFPSPADAYDVTRSRRQGFLLLLIGILHEGFPICTIAIIVEQTEFGHMVAKISFLASNCLTGSVWL